MIQYGGTYWAANALHAIQHHRVSARFGKLQSVWSVVKMRFSQEERASQGSTQGSRIAELLATWSRLVSCQVARSSSTWSSTLLMLAAWAAQRGSRHAGWLLVRLRYSMRHRGGLYRPLRCRGMRWPVDQRYRLVRYGQSWQSYVRGQSWASAELNAVLRGGAR